MKNWFKINGEKYIKFIRKFIQAIVMITFILGLISLWSYWETKNKCFMVGTHVHKGVVYDVRIDSAGTDFFYKSKKEDALKTIVKQDSTEF